MRERDEHDFYETPESLVDAVLTDILGIPYRDGYSNLSSTAFVLDPGAGTGVWGKAIKKRLFRSTVVGVDVRDLAKPEGYDYWLTADYLKSPAVHNLNWHYDIILGNPPYKYAESFIEESIGLLRPGGKLVFLLRLAFLESRKRYDRWFSQCNDLHPREVWVSTRRVSFTQNGKSDDTAYALFVWHKTQMEHHTPTELRWLSWDYAKSTKTY